MKQESYFKISGITGKKYDVFKSIKILNISQTIFYLQNNVPLQDLFVSNDRKTGKSVLVFVFLKEDTREVFNEWCKRGENNV